VAAVFYLFNESKREDVSLQECFSLVVITLRNYSGRSYSGDLERSQRLKPVGFLETLLTNESFTPSRQRWKETLEGTRKVLAIGLGLEYEQSLRLVRTVKKTKASTFSLRLRGASFFSTSRLR